jgi:hypothetical protein
MIVGVVAWQTGWIDTYQVIVGKIFWHELTGKVYLDLIDAIDSFGNWCKSNVVEQTIQTLAKEIAIKYQ